MNDKYGPHYNGLNEPWMWAVVAAAIGLVILYALIWA